MNVTSVNSSLGGYDPSSAPSALSSVSAQAKNSALQELLGSSASSEGPSGAAPSVTSAVNQSILDMLL
jgi:hypothetical protein